MRKHFFSVRVLMHWHRLPREWWGNHPWRCSKRGETWHWGTQSEGMGWWMDLKILVGFSNLNDSMVKFTRTELSQSYKVVFGRCKKNTKTMQMKVTSIARGLNRPHWIAVIIQSFEKHQDVYNIPTSHKHYLMLTILMWGDEVIFLKILCWEN